MSNSFSCGNLPANHDNQNELRENKIILDGLHTRAYAEVRITGPYGRMTVSRLLQEQSRIAAWNGRDADQGSNTVGTTCIAVGAH
jgi:hypothetical protein